MQVKPEPLQYIKVSLRPLETQRSDSLHCGTTRFALRALKDMTQYLNFDVLESIDSGQYLAQKPYPWISRKYMLSEEGYEALRQNMPDKSLFEQSIGYRRVAGQAPHDRYSLEYREDLLVPEPWQAFIAELRSDRYRDAIARLFDVNNPEFRFHWHYAPRGCSVSPHCDSKREYGSQLFYFNTEEEWDPNWGGQTDTEVSRRGTPTNISPTRMAGRYRSSSAAFCRQASTCARSASVSFPCSWMLCRIAALRLSRAAR